MSILNGGRGTCTFDLWCIVLKYKNYIHDIHMFIPLFRTPRDCTIKISVNMCLLYAWKTSQLYSNEHELLTRKFYLHRQHQPFPFENLPKNN